MNRKNKKLESFYVFEIQKLDVIFSTFSCYTFESNHLFWTLDVIFCLCFIVLVVCTAVNAVAVNIVIVVVGDIIVVFLGMLLQPPLSSLL